MSNEHNHMTTADGRQGRSFSQGSAGSYLNSWLSGRFSPNTSTNFLGREEEEEEGEEGEAHGDLENDGDEDVSR